MTRVCCTAPQDDDSDSEGAAGDEDEDDSDGVSDDDDGDSDDDTSADSAEDGDSDEEDAGEGGSADGEALSAGGVFIDAPMDSGSDSETAVSLRSWHPCRIQLLSLPVGCNGRYLHSSGKHYLGRQTSLETCLMYVRWRWR